MKLITITILLVIFILVILFILVLAYLLKNRTLARIELFENLFNDPQYEKNRTLLYGSLFLDNLDEQIKRLTDPPITYDTKRIEIIKYSDVLL